MVCLVLFVVSFPAWGQCPEPPAVARNPTVRLDVIEPKLVYRHDVDLYGLGRIRNTFEKAPAGWIMLGVTITSDQLSMEVRPVVLRQAGGSACVWVTEVAARIGDPELDVYVAANYPEGTCEYDVVREHENQHVEINRGVVHAWAPRIGAELRHVVAQSFPVSVAGSADVRQLPRMLMDRLRPLLDGMRAEMRQKNGALDTPENYRRTAARCKNWFPDGTRLPDR
ncbi:hypothetical protein CWS72_15490 [Telmatospirillum siberiense]|uniref:DUF922 domain-containing protein n=1 Tax=Telmatospirillum siberiense TaxID=382514 RepID=A0A2N3PTF1_9PROT|nr:hypothetical protein CWS72_15490 [Telmatospirillum siberiense]